MSGSLVHDSCEDLEKDAEPPHVDDSDILILDRGLFDAVCWLRFMERLERIRPQERQSD